MRKSPPTQT